MGDMVGDLEYSPVTKKSAGAPDVPYQPSQTKFLDFQGASLRQYNSHNYEFDPKCKQVVQSGKLLNQLEEEEVEQIFNERLANLREKHALTDEEFDDFLADLGYTWTAELVQNKEKSWNKHIPAKVFDKMQAEHKLKWIRKRPQLWKDYMLLRPLAINHPTMVWRHVALQYKSRFSRDQDLNKRWFVNEERIAGFTYEDMAELTDGGKFSGSQWSKLQAGDKVTGTVKCMTEKGAYIEYGGKNWGWIPTEYCAIIPLNHPNEVLSLGQELTCLVLDPMARSEVPKDYVGFQAKLSLTDIAINEAWGKLMDMMDTSKTTDRTVSVFVQKQIPGGVQVMTKEGLKGVIATAQLADKATDPTLVGQELFVEILEVRETNKMVRDPVLDNTPIVFSYTSAASRTLASKLELYQVVSCQVARLNPTNVLLRCEGVLIPVSPMDITRETVAGGSLKLGEIFTEGETVKAMVKRVDRVTGAIELSFKMLEAQKGLMLEAPEKVYAMADKVAVVIKQKMLKAQAAQKSRFDSAAPPPKKTGRPKNLDDGGLDDGEVSF